MLEYFLFLSNSLFGFVRLYIKRFTFIQQAFISTFRHPFVHMRLHIVIIGRVPIFFKMALDAVSRYPESHGDTPDREPFARRWGVFRSSG
jgi:hypothetical protein